MSTDPRWALLEACRRSPLAWLGAFLPEFNPHEWQRQVLAALEDPGCHRMAYVCPRGAGKTKLNAILIMWYMTTRPDCVVVAVTPVWRQAESLRQELLSIWSDSHQLRGLFPGWKIEAEGISTPHPGWRCSIATASNAQNLEGAHSTKSPPLVLIDEAARLPDDHFNSLQGILTTPGSVEIASSVAGKPEGWFYRSYHGDRWLWQRTFIFTAADLPHLAAQYKIERARLGPDDPTFRQQWLSEFKATSEWSIFSPELIESCIGLDPDLDDEVIPGHGPPRIRRMGWDVSRSGDDSVLCLTVGRRVAEFATLPKVDLMQQVAMTIEQVHRWRVQDIAVDAIGMGLGVCSRLAEQLAGLRKICRHEHKVTPFNASRKAEDGEKYFNKKTELVLNLKRLMEDGQIGFPARRGDQTAYVDRLSRELQGLRLIETFRGASRIQDPDASPDVLDSMLIALSLREGLGKKVGVFTYSPTWLGYDPPGLL